MGVSSAGPHGPPDGQILLRLARPFDDGTTALRFEPTAFLERLVALVPRPGRPMLTYHGILAPAASWRDHVVPASPPRRSPVCADSTQPNASSATATSSLSSEQETLTLPRRHERFTWAELLRRVYALNLLVCDACGARRKLLAFLTAP